MKLWKCPICFVVFEGNSKELPSVVAWHINKHEKDREEKEKLSNTAKWKRFNEQFKR